MTTTTTPAPAGPPAAGRDRGTYGGMLAVAVAAAVLSFSALAGLAVLAGVTAALPLPAGGRFRLAWLLPIAVDAYAVTATRVWLRTAGTARTRVYARRNAVGAIGLSVAGNAAYHALAAAGVTSLADVRAGWAVVVAVSAVPPVLLGLVGHLHALVSDDHRTAPAGPPAAVPTTTPAAGIVAPHPARAAGRTGTPAPGRTGTRTASRKPGRTDADLAAVLVGLPREADGTVPIRRATAALGCGPDRARRLLEAAGLLRTTPAGAAPTTDPAPPVDPADPAHLTDPIAA